MTPSVILAALALAAAAGCAATCLVLVRRLRRLEALAAHAGGVERDLAALCAAQRRVGDRVAVVEKEARKVLQDQTRMEMRSATPAHYRQAIALAARGADAGDLVRDCGLAPGEAELMARLHRLASDWETPRTTTEEAAA